MTRPEWLDEPHIQAAIAKAVDSAPPLSDDQLDLLRRNGFFTASASATSAASDLRPATVPDAAELGAAGPRDIDGACGEVGVVTVGRSGGNRPAAPTTSKARSVAADRAKSNAAR